MTTNTDTIKIQNVVTEAQRQLSALDARHQQVSHNLGEALAKVRLGDKKAERVAASLSMDRAKLDNERSTLRLELAALEGQLEGLEAEDAARRTAGMVTEFIDMTEHARQLERTLTEQMRAAEKTALELRNLGTVWQGARNRLAKSSLLESETAALVAPRDPRHVMHPGMTSDPEKQLRIFNAPPYRYRLGTPTFQVVADQPKPMPIRITEDLSMYFREEGA